MSFTPFLSGKILEAVGHGIPYSVAGTWVGLLDTTNTEVSNVDYARIQINPSTGSDPKWSVVLSGSSGSRIENSTGISFGTTTVDWGDVKSVSLYDTSTGGNEIMRQPLPSVRNMLAGDSFRIAAQAIKIRLVKSS